MNPLPTQLEYITSRRQTGPVRLPEGIEPDLPELTGIRAVVFDVYGTLFSSGVGDISLATEENRDAALRATLAAHGLEPDRAGRDIRLDDRLHSVIHHHQSKRRAAGVRYPEVDIRAVWKEFLRELSSEQLIADPDRVSIETLAVDYETRVNPVQPMPGLAACLAKLRTLGPLAIISNAQFYTPILFEAFLGQPPEALGFCPDCNVWSYALLEGKPSRALYEEAARRLEKHHGLSPAECLYVGNDMRNDIWPAQETGFRTALFAGDRLSLRLRRDHPECRGRQADAVLTSLDQIAGCIGLEKEEKTP